jgi:hypothetical protein
VTSPRDYKKKSNPEKVSVLRIRDAYPGSRIRIFAIPDAGSRLIKILDPGSLIRGRIKEFRYFNPKIVSKLSEKWSGLFIPDPDPDFYPSRIPDPGVNKALDPRSRIKICNTERNQSKVNKTENQMQQTNWAIFNK